MTDNHGRAILLYALGRWQTSAIVLAVMAGIAATLLLFGLGGLPIVLAWVALGALGVGGMIVLSFRDERSVREALSPPIELGELRTAEMRESVRRAVEYRDSIRDAVAGIASPELRASLATITSPATDPAWLIFTLGKRVETYRQDRIIQGDLSRLRAGKRSGRLAQPDEQHLGEIERLAGLIDEASATIDKTLAQLGASYAEIQTIAASGDVKGGRARMAFDELKQRSAELSAIREQLEAVRQT